MATLLPEVIVNHLPKMKNYMRKVLLALSVSLILSVTAKAQYTSAIGIDIDFGSGGTLVGPSYKHFFTSNHVGQFEVMFGNNYTVIEAFYQYHRDFPNASGLQWFLGVGAGFGLYDGGSNFLLRPVGGLDYKIGSVPLSFTFDWRPTITIGSGDSDFEPARFAFGIRYVLK